AFSGKDPTKVDRSATYMARHVAKNLVAAELADRVEVKLAYAIGRAQPVAVDVRTPDGRVSAGELRARVRDAFDLRPAAVIDHLGLARPLYAPLSAYGHFGRSMDTAPWEACEHAAELGRAPLRVH
ncbi:MAG: methionine adenosyltransferase domain-containing protein, partial [Candidatus Bipolaricaulia bacterium]